MTVGVAARSKCPHGMVVWSITMIGWCIQIMHGHKGANPGDRATFSRKSVVAPRGRTRLSPSPFAFSWMDAAPMIHGEGLNFTRREAGEEEITFGPSAMETIAEVYSSRLFWTAGTSSGRHLDSSVPAEFPSLKDAVSKAHGGQRILISRGSHHLQRPLNVRGSNPGVKRGRARLLHLEGQVVEEERVQAPSKQPRRGSRGGGGAQREEGGREDGGSKLGGESGEVEVLGRMRLSLRSGGTMVQLSLTHSCAIPSDTLLEVRGAPWAFMACKVCAAHGVSILTAARGNLTLFNCTVGGVSAEQPAEDAVIGVERSGVIAEQSSFVFVGGSQATLLENYVALHADAAKHAWWGNLTAHREHGRQSPGLLDAVLSGVGGAGRGSEHPLPSPSTHPRHTPPDATRAGESADASELDLEREAEREREASAGAMRERAAWWRCRSNLSDYERRSGLQLEAEAPSRHDTPVASVQLIYLPHGRIVADISPKTLPGRQQRPAHPPELASEGHSTSSRRDRRGGRGAGEGLRKRLRGDSGPSQHALPLDAAHTHAHNYHDDNNQDGNQASDEEDQAEEDKVEVVDCTQASHPDGTGAPGAGSLGCAVTMTDTSRAALRQCSFHCAGLGVSVARAASVLVERCLFSAVAAAFDSTPPCNRARMVCRGNRLVAGGEWWFDSTRPGAFMENNEQGQGHPNDGWDGLGQRISVGDGGVGSKEPTESGESDAGPVAEPELECGERPGVEAITDNELT